MVQRLPRPLHKTKPDEIDVFKDLLSNPHPPDQLVVYLKGPVGTDVAPVELVYRDGTRQQLPIRHHYVLCQLNSRSFVAGHTPIELTAHNRAGRVIVARYVSY
jgi:hypothetical protein